MITVKIAFRNIFRNKRRTILTLFTLVFGVVGMILFGGFVENAGYGMREAVIYTEVGHIQIYKLGFRKEGKTDPLEYMISDYDEVKKKLEGLKHVRLVTPRVNFSAIIEYGDKSTVCVGKGVVPEVEGQLISLSPIVKSSGDGNFYIEGTGISSDDVAGVEVGSGFAESMGVKVGDTMFVLGTAEGGSSGEDIRLKGIFKSGIKQYDEIGMRVPLELAQKFLDTENVSNMVVVLDKTENTDLVVAELNKLFSEKNLDLECEPWYEIDTSHQQVTNMLNSFFGFFRLIIAIIIILSIVNTLTMSVMERVREIGTLRAIGTLRRSVVKLFFYEGIIMGIIGGVLGIILGMIIAIIVNIGGITIPPPPVLSRNIVLHIMLVPKVIIQSFVIAVVISFLSSIVPVRKAARMNITDALRHI